MFSTTFRGAILAAFLALPGPALAQTYPERGETPVTDDADMLPPVAEAELAQRLVEIRQDTGTDIAVVTLISQALYTMGDDLGSYATALMDDWSMGGTSAGKAAMLLVFRDDDELRLQLGPAFGDEADATARAIVDEAILPEFREGRMEAGIEAGVEALATRLLAAPDPDSETATPTAAGSGNDGPPIVALFAAFFGIPIVIFGVIVGRAALKQRSTPCEKCGAKGLDFETITHQPATNSATGRGERRATCRSCGHVAATAIVLPVLGTAAAASSGPPGAGGGGGGGGASGSW